MVKNEIVLHDPYSDARWGAGADVEGRRMYIVQVRCRRQAAAQKDSVQLQFLFSPRASQQLSWVCKVFVKFCL